MSKYRSTLQVKRSGKQHKISTSWGGWGVCWIQIDLSLQTMTSPGKSTPPSENAWDSCAKFNYVVGSTQAPLYLELRAGLQSLTDELMHLKSRIFDQRSLRWQEQRYVEYFGLPKRVCKKNLQIFHARSSKRGKRPHDHRPQLHVLHRLRNVQS